MLKDISDHIDYQRNKREKEKNLLRENIHLDLTEEEYAFSTLYLDVVAELERMGDYIINISEALDTATRS